MKEKDGTLVCAVKHKHGKLMHKLDAVMLLIM